MRVTLELLRIILLLGILGGLGSALLKMLYTGHPSAEPYLPIGSFAILILFFVLYRNKLQFSGWYKGEGKAKLSKSVTTVLISLSILIMLLPFLLGVVF